MKVYEVEAVFKVIQGTHTWTITYKQHVFDQDWGITIEDDKGRSAFIRHFGPLNNDTVVELLKANLFLL